MKTAYMKTIILSFHYRNSLNITIYAISRKLSCLSKMGHDLHTKSEKNSTLLPTSHLKDLSQY